MSTVRVVRPRPLGINDRIPVFWAGQEPSQELKQIDGGALYRHLVASSTPTKNRKRKKPEQYLAPKEGEAHEHFTPHRRAQAQQANGHIRIPRVRVVEDYALNQQAAALRGPLLTGDIAAAPYVRHKELLPGMYEEHQVPEYNVDEQDLAWLNNINSKNGQGLLAAAVGLYHQMTQRISRSSSDAAATQASANHGVRLPVDVFEKAVDLLELTHFEAVKAWWDQQQNGASTSAPKLPSIPSMKRMLPRAAALEALAQLTPDGKLAAQVLDYWLKKRQQEGGPLLSRLWFEQPWKFVAFAEYVVSDDEDFDEHLPFMAVEPRSALKNRRGANQRRRAISEEDAVEALYSLRNELEVLRTLADQVRKREKLKRQLMVMWQQETQMRVQLGLSPSAPLPRPRTARQQRQSAPSTGTAGTSAAAAAGTSKAAPATAGAVSTTVPASLPAGQPSAIADVSKRLAKAADVAAAAASPVDGSHARQTRTSAAAAAAAFEVTFAAKRKILAANSPSPEAVRPSRLGRSAAGAAKSAEADTEKPVQSGSRAQKRKRAGLADGGTSTGRKQRRKTSLSSAVNAGDADDEMEPNEERQPSPSRSRLLSTQQQAAEGGGQKPSMRRRQLLKRHETAQQRADVGLQGLVDRQQELQKQKQKRSTQTEQQGQLPADPQEKQRSQKQKQRHQPRVPGKPGISTAAAPKHRARRTSSSDESDDPDYSVSEQEAELAELEQQQVQRQPRRQQRRQLSELLLPGARVLRNQRRLAEDSSSNHDSSSSEDAAEEQEWDFSNDFTQPSLRSVSVVKQLPQQAQHQQRQKRTTTTALQPKQHMLRQQKQNMKPAQFEQHLPATSAQHVAGRGQRLRLQQTSQPGGVGRQLATRRSEASNAAAAASTAVDRGVLKPHNQQQRTPKHSDIPHIASKQAGWSAAAGPAVVGKAVAARSSGGAVRPASGGSRSVGAGSKRLPGNRKQAVGRGIGRAELKSLGITPAVHEGGGAASLSRVKH